MLPSILFFKTKTPIIELWIASKAFVLWMAPTFNGLKFNATTKARAKFLVGFKG